MMDRELHEGSAGPDPAEPAASAPPPVRGWRRFNRWRRARPFWGALLIILAGAEIWLTELAPIKVVVHLGVEGLAGQAVPVVMILCGLLLWFSPEQRMFYAILSVMLALASWVTSNLGGFFFGLLVGVIGGSMAFAWAPGRPPRRTPSPPTPGPADPS